jgi:hypothetical protein
LTLPGIMIILFSPEQEDRRKCCVPNARMKIPPIPNSVKSAGLN